MKYKSIKVQSYADIELEQELIDQGSDTLVIQFPGYKYSIMAPYLYYPYNIAVEIGYDVLTVEYGCQKTNISFNIDDMDNIIMDCKNTIDKTLENKRYKSLIFYSKCLGTNILSEIARYYQRYNTKFIFVTPWISSIPLIKESKSLVIVGTDDGNFKKENVEEISNLQDVKLFVVQGANHDLDTKNCEESIEILLKSCSLIKEFMQ